VTIKQIAINPFLIKAGERFRKDNDLEDEFLESIKSKGILQPLTITPDNTLIAGGRRLAAALLLGLPEVPCLVRSVEDELDLRECELIENAFRKDLSWLDRNSLINRINELMKEKHGDYGSQARTAEILNKSVGGIARHVQLNKGIQLFPDLAKCKTEDEAVRTFRKLSEKILAKHLVKEHAAALSSEGEREGLSTGKSLPLGIQLARGAQSHYNVGDAFVGMQEMLDENLKPPIALVEIDPPYGIDLKEVKKGEDRKNIGEYNEIDKDLYTEFLSKTLDLVQKVTPKSCRILLWHGIEWYDTITRLLDGYGYYYDIIPALWVKPSGQTASPDRYLARCYESFLIAWKGDPPPMPKRGRSNVFEFNTEPHSRKYHPTQRPVELMVEILKTFTWPGSIVMIPFLGSGATIRACYRLGMTGFGWDLSEIYKEHFVATIQTDITEGRLNVLEIDDAEPAEEVKEEREYCEHGNNPLKCKKCDAT